MDWIPQGQGQKDSMGAAVWLVEVLLRGVGVTDSLETGSDKRKSEFPIWELL